MITTTYTAEALPVLTEEAPDVDVAFDVPSEYTAEEMFDNSTIDDEYAAVKAFLAEQGMGQTFIDRLNEM